MKLLLLLSLAFTMPTHADPVLIDKTPRMAAIEVHFNLHMVGVMRSGKTDLWIFICPGLADVHHEFPVVVKREASNHDVDVAILAARGCASYNDYQHEVTPVPSASPSPSAFTMPTRPPFILHL